ncbi:MAG: ABC transporter substrate-binding protein [Alphaproteobacteria bacterium]|nr:ABC transporter substrate-binding protein [Alphaproteobacteria bacterium]
MARHHSRIGVSRRSFVGGAGALSVGLAGFPAILGAQAKSVKVGLIHPVTGFVAYNGQQSRLGGTMAIEDVNKAGGIKSMGGAKLEALLGDSQSKVEVGVSEVEKMNEAGVAAYIGCFQSPVGIAATQAAAKYNTPFLIDVGASDAIVTRGLKNVFRLKPGFGKCVDEAIVALGAINKGAGGPAKTAVIVHENGEFGTGTAKLLAGKLPSIGIEAKELIPHDNPTRNFDNIALRIRSSAPDIVMMSNYGNEYMLLARTLFQQKVDLKGMFSVLGGGFNYKFVKDMPDASQYMMDCNHWYNPRSEAAQALKKRVEAGGALFTFEVYLTYTNVMLLADALERAQSADKEKLLAALASSTFKAELMPYGATKFVDGQNQGGLPATMQSLKGEIEVIAPEQFASAKAVFPRPKFT